MKRRIFSILFALVLVMGISTTSFASTSVTVHFQSMDTTVSNPIGTNIISPVTISANSTDTIQATVNTALAQASTTFIPTWINVPASEDYPAYTYLKSIAFGSGASNLYDTVATYTPENGKTRYQGYSWVWNFTGGAFDFPSDYMNEATVGNNSDVYLLYQYSSFLY